MDGPTIRWSTTVSDLDASALAGGFFEGWSSPPSPDEHVQILRRASHVVLACEGDEVIGFATALSDGVLTAYIPLSKSCPGIGAKASARSWSGASWRRSDRWTWST